MLPQFTNQVLSSSVLWMDNLFANKGQAYSIVSGYFYQTDNLFNGFFTYSSPYRQIIADSSVSGATVMTGIALNGVSIGTGQSGFSGIDYYNGRLYFGTEISNPSTSLSGTYSIKEFNIALTNEPDEKLLFETKYSLKPKTTQTISGLYSNEENYPIIFLRDNGGQNDPFAFGGTDNSVTNLRAIILTDSMFSLDAATSLLKDQARNYIPLLGYGEMPFNSLGGLKSGVYNYTGMTNGKAANGQGIYISNVFVSRFNHSAFSQELKKINPDVFVGLVDLDLEFIRNPD